MQNSQRKVEIVRAGERRPFKPKKWSHQQELEKLRGRKVKIQFVGKDDYSVGILREADQFTVLIEFENKSILTYFKHDMRSIGAV